MRSRGQLLSIQYLRGIAAAMVVFAHANEQFMTGSHQAMRDIGWSGVDIFFVISGFVMTYTTAMHDYSRKTFMTHRIARIVPLYWLMTFVTVATLLIAPSVFKTTRFGLENFLASLLFIPVRDPIRQVITPTLHLGWTLNYEMFFYAWFAVLLYLAPGRRTAMLALIFGGLVLLGRAFLPTVPALAFWTRPVMLEFVLGCVVAYAYLNLERLKLPRPAIFACFLAGIALLVVGSLYDHEAGMRWLYRGPPAAMVVFSLAAMEQTTSFGNSFLNRCLHRIGDATYSIYLTHIFVVSPIRFAWLHAGLPTTEGIAYLFVAICVVCGLGVGIFCYETVESRLNTWAKNLLGISKRGGQLVANA